MSRRPKLVWMILAHLALIVVVAIVLYPVMLVCKKAIEPGRQFALSASPIPTDLTASHFTELFTTRGAHGELLFLRHAINSIIVAVLTTIVGVSLSCTAAYALSPVLRLPDWAGTITISGFLYFNDALGNAEDSGTIQDGRIGISQWVSVAGGWP